MTLQESAAFPWQTFLVDSAGNITPAGTVEHGPGLDRCMATNLASMREAMSDPLTFTVNITLTADEREQLTRFMLDCEVGLGDVVGEIVSTWLSQNRQPDSLPVPAESTPLPLLPAPALGSGVAA